ncbi:hypothetical protein QBC35DRAFT_508077 [Podospora australis]|uniref:DNA-directed RNA polymerase III subunit n=1 Tax=Podospora australis TaxID=1536484 RepID=A0AAN6WNA8_9PEZI|nr:hypothetical protein QBC35DRAFT_508077 [Podospora australis]
MSGRGGRGGRGRGRGGPMMNGRRAVAANSTPWATMDTGIELDGKPAELFPPYKVPKAPVPNKKEEKQISYFLLFREQCHDSPLYTHSRTWVQDRSTTNKRTYGQDQINRRYGQSSEATVDAFNAVPTYSQQFQQTSRTLPDLSSWPFAKEFFPPELHATLDGEDEPANKRRKTGPKSLGLSNITSYKTAEDLEMEAAAEQAGGGAEHEDINKALELLNRVEKNTAEGGEDGFLSGEDDDDWVKNNEGDEDAESNAADSDEYDDESGDDYNAEQYFDEGDNDDYDDGGEDGGQYYD